MLEKPVERVSMFLPPTENFVLGHPVLVDAYKYLSTHAQRDYPEQWGRWRKELLLRKTQKLFWGTYGIWCFLVFKGNPPRKDQIAYELGCYLVNGYFLRDKKRGDVEFGRLLKERHKKGSSFLGSQIVEKTRGLMNPYLMLYAGPAPENYNSCRPTQYIEHFVYPQSLVEAVRRYQLLCEQSLPELDTSGAAPMVLAS